MEASVPLGQGSAITAKRVGLMPASLKTPDTLPAGVWQDLLQHAYSLIDEISVHGIQNPFWTFGGGTVLMLRYRHRMSKDIDIFVPDPQYLGFVSPRLSDVAEAVSDKYVEGPGYIKLIGPSVRFVRKPATSSQDAGDMPKITVSKVVFTSKCSKTSQFQPSPPTPR